MVKQTSVLLSNRVISIIAVILAAGILLDGKLYNRAPKAAMIFSLTDPATISIRQQDQLIMAFENTNEQWVMTQPTDAPLDTDRIQLLLDSNHQISRSYVAAELPLEDLFPHPVTIDIDGKQFQLGELEPVSKLRYVLADNRVYLQADHVIPMIRAGATAFLDLGLTDSVTAVEINQQSIQNPESWSSLKALGIVPNSKLDTDPVFSITIKQKSKDNQIFQVYVQEDVVILSSPSKRYGYLISQQQSEQLGLAKYL